MKIEIGERASEIDRGEENSVPGSGEFDAMIFFFFPLAFFPSLSFICASAECLSVYAIMCLVRGGHCDWVAKGSTRRKGVRTEVSEWA